MTSRLLLLAGLLLAAAPASALPLYTARAGRTCDNCHSLPNRWFDPPEILKRKCTLSCASCHVDPSGGGLRNVSGRYYGESTLPMFKASRRPLADWDRDLIARHLGPTPTSQPASEPASGPVKPSAAPDDPRGPGAPPATEGWLAFGRPLGEPAEMAWGEGRYGDLAVDPLLLLGADFRFGAWTQGPLFFPMQGDLHAAVHPVEHFTLFTTVGARGRVRGTFLDTVPADDDQPPFGVRDLWAMTHEWPGLSYLRVGRFLPAFGTRVADHTAPIRRGFGMSQEDPANRVVGVEAGFAANYPYGSVSVYRHGTREARNPFELGDGGGAVASAGIRELGWQVGASARVERRPLSSGGDGTDFSLQWAFNPWYYWQNLPLTYLGEVAWGRYQRRLSGNETGRLAWYHELAYTAFNGVVLRLRHDSWDPDTEVGEDQLARPGLGLDLTFIPGLTLSTDSRIGIPAGASSQPSADVFFQLHGWL
ncbi:MAG: hypothetical protein H6706_11425 [Myxococcales bacterium]|nr:hypothetical protein [Myxococcales bacterium]